MTTNWCDIRADFPILQRTINEQPLIYLDNAATTQKPATVIQAMTSFYEQSNANVYRSVHSLSAEATEAYEIARENIARFIGAHEKDEVIFTSGTTDGINILARSLGLNLEPGDEILLTYMEHHSNIIPWQQIAKAKKAKVVYVAVTADGEVNLEDYQNKLNSRTKIVSFTHVSNVLGTINPVKEMTKMAHVVDALVVVDGAQAVAHLEVDVQALNVDFYVFSGHKVFGPTGIGILYGKMNRLKSLEPTTFGGEMISVVNEEDSTWADVPHKLEAGTPNIAGAIGLGAAVDYLNSIGWHEIKKREEELKHYLMACLNEVKDLEIYGLKQADRRIGVVSFNIKDIHPHDLATALDVEGIAIRAGHHCGQLLMKQLNVFATSRISLSFYNTKDEIDQTIQALDKAREFFNE